MKELSLSLGENKERGGVTVCTHVKPCSKGSLSTLQTGQGVTGLNYSKDDEYSLNSRKKQVQEDRG